MKPAPLLEPLQRTRPRDRLAEIAASTTYEGLPADVRRLAIRIVVDTMAAAKAGLQSPFCSAFAQDVTSRAGSGVCSVVAGGRASAESAIFVNALPATVLQIDEGHRRSRGHPGIHVVPTALAVAEEVDARGEALIEAVVSGYEVAARVGLLLGALPDGVHPHGTWGTFGGAVSAAKLLGIGPGRFGDVIDAVASIPLRPWGRTATQGATLHHLYAPLAGQLALTITRSLIAGATITEGAFESFYVPAFGSTGGIWDAMGYEITNYYFKFYPACAHIHTAIQAIERLQADRRLGADDVVSIEVETYRAAYSLSDPTPQSDLAARFSVPFCLARQLLYGTVGDRLLSTTELHNERTVALAKRVVMRLDPDLDRGYPDARPARLKVTTRDGRILSSFENVPRGDSTQPESEAAWSTKIEHLTGAESAERLLEFVETDPTRWSAREFGAALIGDST